MSVLKDFLFGFAIVAMAIVAIPVCGAAILGGGAILIAILVPIAIVSAAWILVVCIAARISGGRVQFNLNRKKKEEE